MRKNRRIQNKAMRMVSLKPLTYLIDELYSSNKVLKIADYVSVFNCIFVKEVLTKINLEPLLSLLSQAN